MANDDPLKIKLGDVQTNELYVAKVRSTGVQMQCPVWLGLKKDNSNLWLLPLEPLVSVRGSKTVIRRNIAKAVTTGTVKEQWSLNDYEISVSGLLQGDRIFPEADMAKLQSFLVAGQSIVIHCPLLDVLSINLMCIETWTFPETPGVENQRYSFMGYSDQYFDLT